MEFPFPFVPYPMQLEVMRVIRHTIEAEGVAVVEAPTGTGKSQMILNSVLQWLAQQKAGLEQPSSTVNVDDVDELAQTARAARQKANCRKQRRERKRAKGESVCDGDGVGADPFLIDQPDDGEGLRCATLSSSSSDSGDGGGSNTSDSEEDDQRPLAGPLVQPKVYFMSRTHSQLVQLMNEFQKTVFSARSALGREARGSGGCPLRAVHVASRVQLCINADVLRCAAAGRASVCGERLNELCKEAIVNNAKEKRKQGGVCSPPAATSNGKCVSCPFAAKKKVRQLMEFVRGCPDRTLVELKAEGERIGACPYWASRHLLPESDVVLLPYSYMLDGAMRGQLFQECSTAADREEGRCDLEDLAGADRGERKPRRRAVTSSACSASASASVVRGAVLVFDEAHNVADAAMRTVCCEMSESALQSCVAILQAYAARYEQRLLVRNKQKLREIVVFCEKVLAFAQRRRSALLAAATPTSVTGSPLVDVLDVNRFAFDAGIDLVNAYTLLAFLDESDLLRKLRGFSASAYGGEASAAAFSSRDPHAHLYAFVKFLRLWAEASADEVKVLITTVPPQQPQQPASATCSLCVQLVTLVPGVALSRIAHECRALILVGGTLQPFDILTKQLFASLQKPLKTRAFPHVVSPENLAVTTLGTGPSGRALELTHARRAEHEGMLKDVAVALVNFARVVPDGMIVFFASYAFLDQFVRVARASGDFDALNTVKPVVVEARGEGDATLERFRALIRSRPSDLAAAAAKHGLHPHNDSVVPEDADDDDGDNGSCSRPSATPAQQQLQRQCAAHGGSGAVLLAVMGGKLSEGINFNDEYGRCVVVVGLPYPNPNDVVFKLLAERAAGATSNATLAFGSALCMRSVNQSIGRCIRHLNDFATVVLLDVRFGAHEHIFSKISPWMRDSTAKARDFGECFRRVRDFFGKRREAAVKEKK